MRRLADYRIIGFGCLGVIAMLLFSYCAQPGTPTGGPQDKEGPMIKDTLPLPRSLNFQGDEVILKFNEFIKTPTYGKEIFISPFMAVQPEVKVVGKKLKIRFKESLRPSTTYVISMIDIKDVNASNSMEPPFTLAFSTGAVIDSMEVAGKVVNREKKGMPEYTIMLFEADSIEGHDFMGKRPAYLTKTDKSGNFTLSYLRNIPYRIYGISDIDRSNTYSMVTEPLALAADPDILFSDSTEASSLELQAFSPDVKAPALRSYSWLSDSVLLCHVTRGLRADSLRLSVSDTLGQDSQAVTRFSYLNQQLLIEMPRKRETPGILHIHAMVDSLGHAADSSLRLRASRPQKPEFYPLFTKVKIEPTEKGYAFYLPRTLEEADLQAVSLRDTGNRPIRVRLKRENFRLLVRPDTVMNPSLLYKLCLDGKLFGQVDTIFRYKVTPWEPESYGSLSGKIKINGYQGPFVVFFKGPQNFSLTDSVFQYAHLPAGDYKLSLLLDKDASGSWTPGSLSPYTLPERIISLNAPISIRANWTIEDQLIEFDTRIEAVQDSLKK